MNTLWHDDVLVQYEGGFPIACIQKRQASKPDALLCAAAALQTLLSPLLQNTATSQHVSFLGGATQAQVGCDCGVERMCVCVYG
jgi:hypothetical protein